MIKKVVVYLWCLALITACSSSDDPSVASGDNFNRQAMLINWADNMIIPAFQDLNTNLNDLVSIKNTFVATPNQTNLEAFQSAWLVAYKTWQHVEMFNIGKAEEINYVFQMNVYPTNVSDITSNINSGDYDLANVNNNDAVGFPALDYMLFGIAETNSGIIDAYTVASNANNALTYLSDLVNQMQSLTEIVLNDWINNYRDTFVNSTANTATSATNQFTNDFIYYYEKGLRANKFGIPAGVFSVEPLSEKVEAYYNEDASKILALEALQTVQDVFNGKAYNSSASGESFNSYITYLNTIKDGEDLSTLINNQIELARTKIQVLDDNFAQQVQSDNMKMTEAYDELQKAVILFKVDMIQAMNISVDFQDADGD